MASVASFLSILVDVEGRSRTWPQGHLASLARLRHFICWNHDYTHIATVINSNDRDADVIWNSRIPLFSNRSLKSNRAKTESCLMMGSWKIFLETPEIPTKEYKVKNTWGPELWQTPWLSHLVFLDLWEESASSFPLADKTRPWNTSLGWRPWL